MDITTTNQSMGGHSWVRCASFIIVVAIVTIIITVGIVIIINFIIFEDAWNCRFLLHRRRGTETTNKAETAGRDS